LVPDHAFRPVLFSVAPVALAGFGAILYDSEHATSALRFTFGSMIATGAVWEGLSAGLTLTGRF
jgi:hypothetical protein